ncbi:MAG: sigma-70 family RNA polymerase sigma factor [Anaerolineae bacterium]|nr:sigma-70 family RNA polymerase sigma factor [Anaerolineae bacterium]
MNSDADGSETRDITSAKAGDEVAFGRLVRRHEGIALRVAQRIVGTPQEAEDVVQDALIRAYRALDRFDETRPFGPWLYRIVTNLSLNRLRQRRDTISWQGTEEDPLPIPAPLPGPEAQILTRETHERLYTEINALPDHYRRVLALRHGEGLSYQEIANRLHVPVSDVKSWLFRARKRLKERLEPGIT